MVKPIDFKIDKKLPGKLGRAGRLITPHGVVNTPAFVVVGTKATVKSLTPEQVKELGAECVLANTYHLYLEPGAEVVDLAGGLHPFMNWSGPTMTDSGGFQVFSLGAAYGEGGVSKFAKNTERQIIKENVTKNKLAKIDEEGVTFRSHLDGSTHRLTPEISMAIQHKLGADIIFAFDECTSPNETYDYQIEAMERTHRWAKRSLEAHIAQKEAFVRQGLFGIVQGGKYRDLRETSAKYLTELRVKGEGFAGFGIGGSFSKDDLSEALGWVNNILPEDKPRHLLGIGEVADLFTGIENGIDTFDCVLPTRMARNGTLLTSEGRINILNAKYRNDFTPVDTNCNCYTCRKYTKAYLAHLFRANEMLASTLASIHNLYFLVNLVKKARQSILDDSFYEYKEETLRRFNKINNE